MLGSAYCHLEKKHVAVDALIHYVGPKTARGLSIFAELVVLFVVVVMLYVSIPAAYRSYMIRERSTHQTPFNPQIWWYRWIIPISCALISWQAFKDMLSLIRGKKEGERNAA
jgi:TRAP-type C4-dicarboxylate transport system permease small subunit